MVRCQYCAEELDTYCCTCEQWYCSECTGRWQCPECLDTYCGDCMQAEMVLCTYCNSFLCYHCYHTNKHYTCRWKESREKGVELW